MFSSKLRNVAVVGDVFLIFMFPFLGGASHSSPLTLEGFVRTFVPFALAWLVVGALTGSFTLGTIRSFRRAYRRVPLALVASGVVAIVLRVVVFDRSFEFTFALVAIAVTTLLISVWRVVLASIPGR